MIKEFEDRLAIALKKKIRCIESFEGKPSIQSERYAEERLSRCY